MNTNATAREGFLDKGIVPGAEPGTAWFRIITTSTDDVVDDAIIPCVTTDPLLTHAVMEELQPNDQLRATGTLHFPTPPHGALYLHVEALEVLETAVYLTEQAADQTSCIDRYGTYVVFLNADTTTVPVWTETGRWVGTADDPNSIAQLVNEFERRMARGDT